MHITYEESIKILNNNLPFPKNSEKVFLSDALNRVLAEDIKATFNSPDKLTASMDGYAIRYEDIKNKLKLIGVNKAGEFKFNKLNKNEAIKTFTGSYMPENADTLVPKENVIVYDEFIEIIKEVEKGFAIREVAENFRKGEVLLKKGTLLKSAELAILASLNIAVVEVIKKPVISILSTGEELVDICEDIDSNHIRSVNNYLLSFFAKEKGFLVNNLGIVKDNKDLIKSKILDALVDSDIVVTTGGVSVGDFDFVKDITKEFNLLFYGVDIKPGQWIMLAKFKNKFIVSLPGFPYSSFVTFLLYVLPIAASFEGKENIFRTVKAKLAHDFDKKFVRTQFVAVNLDYDTFEVDTFNKKEGSSAIVTNLINTRALMKLDYGIYKLKKGDFVDVILF